MYPLWQAIQAYFGWTTARVAHQAVDQFAAISDDVVTEASGAVTNAVADWIWGLEMLSKVILLLSLLVIALYFGKLLRRALCHLDLFGFGPPERRTRVLNIPPGESPWEPGHPPELRGPDGELTGNPKGWNQPFNTLDQRIWLNYLGRRIKFKYARGKRRGQDRVGIPMYVGAL